MMEAPDGPGRGDQDPGDHPGPRAVTVQRFLALGVPTEIRERLARATAHLRAPGGDLRANRPAGWHVTLAFLGEVDDEQARVATEVLSSTLTAAAPRPAPRLSLGQVGRFGDRVLLVHVLDDPPGALERFVMVLHTELRTAGLVVPDRPFRPHLTLARARRRRRVRAADATALRIPTLRWRPDAVGRWASVPAGSGAPYTVEVELPWPVSG